MTPKVIWRRSHSHDGCVAPRTRSTIKREDLLPFALVAVVLVAGCAVGGGAGAPGPDVCARLDSLYAHSGFESPLTMAGKVTLDANQYQMRGIIRAEFRPTGDVYFDFLSSMLFGSQIEDFFFSMVGDTVRIVDRERGRLYEGNEAAQFLSKTLAMDFDVVRTLRVAAGVCPPCGDLKDVRIRTGSGGDIAVDGHYLGEGFKVTFAGSGRLDRIEWPVPGEDGMDDRMDAEYRWAESAQPRLRRLTMRMQAREWRCRITATD